MQALALVTLLCGCLGPLVSDTPATRILAAGTVVPSINDDPIAAAAIAAADGLAGTIVRQTSFARGQLVHVWNFGRAPDLASPLFVLVAPDASGALVRIAHPTIVEAVPGTPGYSPFWAVFWIEVTPSYHGELLTSFAAVSEAVDAGLVRAPVAQPFAVNCPITGTDVIVDVGGGRAVGPNATFYYFGKTVPYFDFGPMPLDGAHVPEARRIQLRREGEEPLSEIVRRVDIDGDGDARDTNDILDAAAALSPVTPRLRTFNVATTKTIGSIDTSHDEAIADITSVTQLFAPDPTSLVVSYAPTDLVENWVAQKTVGGL